VIHKLFEEVLNGETPMQESALSTRADELLKDLGIKSSPSSSDGFSPVEIANAVLKGLNVPEVAAVRDRLMPECPVTSAQTEGQEEFATCGIADALAITANGNPELVIDWKSDVTPTPTLIETYKGQVTAYLKATKIRRGLIVFVTTGRIVEVRAD
jgi:exodeoxyribonuclease-5